jgi:hypothetical protein
VYALKSSEARRQYPKRLKLFFDYLGLPGSLEEQATELLERARTSPQWCQDSIIAFLDFHKRRVGRKELAAGTLQNYYRAAKLFCEMNDLTTINWKRISKGLPRVKNFSSIDRAPTLEEIRKLVEYPDRRIKPIVYAMASGGFRLGAWDYLRWKHVSPVTNEKGEVIAAKLIIYADEPEEYSTFITPEAYSAPLPLSLTCSYASCFYAAFVFVFYFYAAFVFVFYFYAAFVFVFYFEACSCSTVTS